jgi:hypothetical protein
MSHGELRTPLSTLSVSLLAFRQQLAEARPRVNFFETVREHYHWCAEGQHYWLVATTIPKCPYAGEGTLNYLGTPICSSQIDCPIHEELSEVSNK